MMNLQELKDTMQKRPLRIGEVLSTSYSLLSQRFGRYLLLSFLVYIPINVIITYFSLQLTIPEQLTEEALLSMMPQFLRLLMIEASMMFLELIAIQVTAVKVKNQLFDEENLPFSRLFYLGIRMWPRGALTLILVIIGLVIAVMCASGFLAIPLLGLIAMPVLVLIMVYFVMYMDLTACCAALRGRFGFDNLQYIAFLLRPNVVTVDPYSIPGMDSRMMEQGWDRYGYSSMGPEAARERPAMKVLQPILGKILLIFIVITLLSNGLSFLVSTLSVGVLSWIQNPIMNIAASVLISSIFAIFNIYSFICAAVVFFNLEEMKKKIEVDSQSNRNV